MAKINLMLFRTFAAAWWRNRFLLKTRTDITLVLYRATVALPFAVLALAMLNSLSLRSLRTRPNVITFRWETLNRCFQISFCEAHG